MGAEHIFRAYDVRGEVPDELDEEVMERIGKSFGTYIQDREEERAVVGRDVRESSPGLQAALIEGIRRTGVDVIDVGMVPYGVALFHGFKKEASSAYVTASHLSSQYNGVKFASPDSVGFVEEQNMEIRDIFTAADVNEGNGRKTEIEALDPYREYLLERVHIEDLDVVIDPGNGAAGVVAPDIFWKAGASTECMNCDPDGSFPNRSSDVTEESLEDLRSVMHEGGRDIGIAYDGDADRAAIVDDRGRLLSAEETAYIALQDLLPRYGGPVVANIECSRLIDDIAAEHGADVIRTRVGHSYLFRDVADRNAVLGVETSRHIGIAPLLPFDDAIAASLYIASVVDRMDRPLSHAVDGIPTYERDRTAFDVDEEMKFEVVEQLARDLSTEYSDTSRKDGIRVDLDDGWILIRASNTSPVIRLTVEAENSAAYEELQQEFSARIESAIAAAT